MKLTTKLVSSFVLCIFILVVVDSYLLVEQAKGILYEDTERGIRLLGKVLKKHVTYAWRKYGRRQAMKVLKSANIRSQHVEVRWLDKKPKILNDAKEGVWLFREKKGKVNHTVHALISVSIPGSSGFVKISQPLMHLEKQLELIQYRTMVWIIGVSVLGVLVVLLFGIQVVGTRLQKLIGKVRSIGKGEFHSPLYLRGNDELSELAMSLNQMCQDMKQAQKQIQAEAKARLEALELLRQSDRLRVVGQLASGVAHEVGTPLNVISGRASLIEKQILTEDETIKSAGVIKQQVEYMTTIINQLLDFARKRVPKRSRVSLWQVIVQACELLEPIAQKSGVSLQLINTQVHSEWVYVEASQITQVVTNLLMNAIQASWNGATIQVGLRSVHRKPPVPESDDISCLCLFVEDTGGGISPEHLPHIFEPFYTTKDVGKGSGLGLSISYGIVQEHNGWIEVTSTLHQGSLFEVLLPQEEQDGV